MNGENRSGMTVAEALADKAAELKATIEWARTRLDRAAALVALATEPDHPNGRPEAVWSVADALSTADRICEGVWNALQEGDEDPSGVVFLATRALEMFGEQSTEAGMDRWNDDHVRRMTVGELRKVIEAPATA